MRIEVPGNDTRATFQQLANFSWRGVRGIPDSIDRLVEMKLGRGVGGSDPAVVDVEISQVGDIQRHGGRCVLLEHSDRVSNLEARRAVVGPKGHRGRTGQRTAELIAKSLQARNGVRLEGT